MRLYRELGVMELDSNGQWIEQPIETPHSGSEARQDSVEEMSLPPVIPAGWINAAPQDMYPRVFRSDQGILDSDGSGDSR